MTEEDRSPLEGEEIGTLDKARKEWWQGYVPARVTLHRHCTVGLNGILLESFFSGSKRVTSREACARFVRRVTEARENRGDQ